MVLQDAVEGFQGLVVLFLVVAAKPHEKEGIRSAGAGGMGLQEQIEALHGDVVIAAVVVQDRRAEGLVLLGAGSSLGRCGPAGAPGLSVEGPQSVVQDAGAVLELAQGFLEVCLEPAVQRTAFGGGGPLRLGPAIGIFHLPAHLEDLQLQVSQFLFHLLQFFARGAADRQHQGRKGSRSRQGSDLHGCLLESKKSGDRAPLFIYGCRSEPLTGA